jgi:hypothetical protein
MYSIISPLGKNKYDGIVIFDAFIEKQYSLNSILLRNYHQNLILVFESFSYILRYLLGVTLKIKGDKKG